MLSTREQFNVFVVDESLRQSHVVRAIVSLSSALMELAAMDDETNRRRRRRRVIVDGSDLSASIANQNAELLANIERRQLTLVSMFFEFVAMTNERYDAIDIGAHVAVAEALVRYETSLVAMRRHRSLGYTSSADAEHVYAALGTALATVAMAYHFDCDPTLPHSNASLHIVLEAARERMVPAARVRDFAKCVRIVILQRFHWSLSDAAFMVRMISSSQQRLQLAASAGESAATLVELLAVGRPRIEQSLSRVSSEALVLLSSSEPVPESLIGALATPLWFVLVVLACARIIDVVRQVSSDDAMTLARQRYSHLLKALFPPPPTTTTESSADFAQQLANVVH